MFSLVKRTLRRAKSFATVIERLQIIEVALVRLEHKIKRFDRLADENEALWDHLDNIKEAEEYHASSSPEYINEITDAMLRKMKTQGDA